MQVEITERWKHGSEQNESAMVLACGNIAHPVHNAKTDKIRLVDVANECDQGNENHVRRNFGMFTESDLC